MEEKGLSAPTSLLEMLRESSLLNDAIHSACCGRPVAWQSFWRHERRGRNKNGRADFVEIFDAHLKLAEKVVRSSFVSVEFAVPLYRLQDMFVLLPCHAVGSMSLFTMYKHVVMQRTGYKATGGEAVGGCCNRRATGKI